MDVINIRNYPKFFRESDITNCEFSPRVMASSQLFSYTQEQLISIIDQQNAEIQSLLNQTSWLQADSNAQYSQAQECCEKVLEWQEYCKSLEKERDNLKTRDELWKQGLTKAVSELNTLKEKYDHLEGLCFPLKMENRKMTQALGQAVDVGKFMYDEYCLLNYNYTSLFNHVWIQGGWYVPLAICQKEEHPTPAKPTDQTVPITVTLPPEGSSAIFPNMPTNQSPPKIPLFIRIQCPRDAFVGANANEKVPPYMPAIQAPRELANEAPCVSADNQTTSEIKFPCGSTVEAPCVCEDKIPCAPDNQTPCATEMKDPSASGNQAPDSPVVCKSEKTDAVSAGIAHLPINESLPEKSTSKVSWTKNTMIIFLLGHRCVCPCVSCQAAHIMVPSPHLIYYQLKITHGWLEALLYLSKTFFLRSRGLHFTKIL